MNIISLFFPNFFWIYNIGAFLQVDSGDLIAYGLIPEFVGRFPIMVSLSGLTEDQLVQVILKMTLFFFSGIISRYCKASNANSFGDSYDAQILFDVAVILYNIFGCLGTLGDSTMLCLIYYLA